jgi:DNA gyrase subunit B
MITVRGLSSDASKYQNIKAELYHLQQKSIKAGSTFEEYEIGKPKADVKKIAKTKHQGTVIEFQADISIFKEINYEWKRIVSHLRRQAYLVKGMRMVVIDAREVDNLQLDKTDVWLEHKNLNVPTQTFYFEGGLRSLVIYQNQIHKPVHKNIFYIDKTVDDMQVDV